MNPYTPKHTKVRAESLGRQGYIILSCEHYQTDNDQTERYFRKTQIRILT